MLETGKSGAPVDTQVALICGVCGHVQACFLACNSASGLCPLLSWNRHALAKVWTWDVGAELKPVLNRKKKKSFMRN